VIEVAREILDILKIPKSTFPPKNSPKPPNAIKEAAPSKKACPFPDAPSTEQVGVGEGIKEKHVPSPGGDAYVSAKAYTGIENEALPAANRLAEALKVPTPRVRVSAHEWRGRYSFRQELRTPDTPNRVRSVIGKASRDIVFYVLVDRSGSMMGRNEIVRLSLMTIYLAAMKLSVPMGIAYFGDAGNARAERKTFTFEVTPVASRVDELAKAYIAGYEGATGAEYLHWGLMLAKDALLRRPERRKFLLVIHDGEPVYDGPLGNDKTLSKADVVQLERQGITTIGIFLGGGNTRRLKEIFDRLVVVPDSSQLADKLGQLLRSLI
jgi:Mg-chelatase subunit ChlD